MNAGLRCFFLILSLLACRGVEGQQMLDRRQKELDLRFLDSLVLAPMEALPMGLGRLQARNQLLDVLSDSLTPSLDWACALHGWLRSAEDPHLRLGFESGDGERCSTAPPLPEVLMDAGAPWERYGPGPGLPESAQAAWIARTWAWIAGFHGCPGVPAEEPESGVEWNAGMQLTFHGTHVRWGIAGFGVGSDEEFRIACKRIVKEIRKQGLPVLLDLRGNLGGFRTRRHSVLSAFLPESAWPEEWECGWGESPAGEVRVEAMPTYRVREPLDLPLAVLLDGLSFSASLLLTDALLHAGRAKVFGSAPLGRPGGCSGTPGPHRLPASGWTVEVPTVETRLVVPAVREYGLVGSLAHNAGFVAEIDAIKWLLSPGAVPSE